MIERSRGTIMKLPKPFARGAKLWFSYKDPATKTWTNRPTGYSVGEDAAACRYISAFMKALNAGSKNGGPMTVARFADRWLANRKTASVNDDRTRLTKHVLPRIGRMEMSSVRPKDIDDVVMALRDEGALAPRTIRQIVGVVSTMFKRATKEEIVVSNPVIMERGTLPKKVDKDPTWRHEAIYTREEAEILLSDPRILVDRRVLYALKFLGGGMRHGEAASLTWRQYDQAAEPLGRINLGKTKSGAPREIPVHPTLAKILAMWKLPGWEETYGRKPTADDLIVPTRNMTARKPAEAQEALIADLQLLELRVRAGKDRNRRGHDLRRTFVTLARTDGAIDGLLRWVTHGSSTDMMDLYTTPPWASLCAEVAKLKIELREGKLIELPAELLTASLQRASAANKRWPNQAVTTKKRATPTGFEPVLPA
jgi:integrase